MSSRTSSTGHRCGQCESSRLEHDLRISGSYIFFRSSSSSDGGSGGRHVKHRINSGSSHIMHCTARSSGVAGAHCGAGGGAGLAPRLRAPAAPPLRSGAGGRCGEVPATVAICLLHRKLEGTCPLRVSGLGRGRPGTSEQGGLLLLGSELSMWDGNHIAKNVLPDAYSVCTTLV